MIKTPNSLFFLKIFFSFFPSFHYSKIWGDIADKSGRHFNMRALTWIKGQALNGVTFTLNTRNFGVWLHMKHRNIENLSDITINIAIFMVLTWYLEIFSPENRDWTIMVFFSQEKLWWPTRKNNIVNGLLLLLWRKRRQMSINLYVRHPVLISMTQMENNDPITNPRRISNEIGYLIVH